ncbi:MAG: hypothetical protein LBO20_07055 [Bifidobacteriaceae bacterium]|jgi:hypothetical protein|nr:hypothetical protein [Bifidobacteriaceae bacterium]
MKRPHVALIVLVGLSLAAIAVFWLTRSSQDGNIVLTGGDQGVTAKTPSPPNMTRPAGTGSATPSASGGAPSQPGGTTATALIPEADPHPEEDWIDGQADPGSVYASLDAAAKKALQDQALSAAFAKTAADTTLAPGASAVNTRREGSGVQLTGARGPSAEFTALVPFEADTAQGQVTGQVLWQVVMVHDGDAWGVEGLTLRGVLS